MSEIVLIWCVVSNSCALFIDVICQPDLPTTTDNQELMSGAMEHNSAFPPAIRSRRLFFGPSHNMAAHLRISLTIKSMIKICITAFLFIWNLVLSFTAVQVLHAFKRLAVQHPCKLSRLTYSVLLPCVFTVSSICHWHLHFRQKRICCLGRRIYQQLSAFIHAQWWLHLWWLHLSTLWCWLSNDSETLSRAYCIVLSLNSLPCHIGAHPAHLLST